MADQDFNYLLTVDPDVKAVEDALKGIGDQVDAVGNQSGKSFTTNMIAGMSAAGKAAEATSQMADLWQTLGELSGKGQVHEEGILDALDAQKEEMKEIVELAQERIDREEKALKVQAAYENLKGQPPPASMLSKILGGFGKGGIGGALKAVAGGGMEGLTGAVVGGAEAGGMGAAAGALAGGPVTIIATVAAEAAKALGKAAAAPFKAINAGLGAVSTGLSELQGPLGPVGAGLALAGDGMKGFADAVGKIPVLGDLFGPMLQQMGAMPGLIRDITSSLVSMAGKASPSAVHLFQIALEDVQGVIGGTFLPVLELMRQGVRLFGDVLANLLPNGEEVRGAMSELFRAFGDLGERLRGVVAQVGPQIRTVLIGAIEGLSKVLAFLADNFEEIATVLTAAFVGLGTVLAFVVLPPVLTLTVALLAAFAPLAVVAGAIALVTYGLIKLAGGFKGIAAVLGIDFGTKEPRSSEGAAARPAHITGIEEYQRQLQVAAFSEPGRKKMDDVPVMLGTFLPDILRAVRETAGALTDPTKLATVVALAIQKILPSASDATDAVKRHAKEAFRWTPAGIAAEKLGLLD